MSDRLKAALTAFVRTALARVDYFALYAARVVSQSGDLATVDLQPDNPLLPGLQAVPLRWGLPGALASVAPGGVVLLGFSGGDPTRPFALSWDQSSALSAMKLAGGGPAAARNGDAVTVTLTVAEIATISSPSGPCSGGPITLSGQIAAGSSKVEIG